MKTGFLATVAAGVLIASPAVAQEDDLLGRWRTSSENGVVEFFRCGSAICARLIDAAPLRADPNQQDVRNRNPDLRSRPLRHLRVMSGFTGGPSVWRGGSLYDPESGRQVERGTLTLIDRNTLEVQGCVARVLCRTQTWQRIR